MCFHTKWFHVYLMHISWSSGSQVAHLGCISNSEAALDCFFLFFFFLFLATRFSLLFPLAHDRASGWIFLFHSFEKSGWNFCPSSRLHPSQTWRCYAKWSGAAFNVFLDKKTKKKNQIHNNAQQDCTVIATKSRTLHYKAEFWCRGDEGAAQSSFTGRLRTPSSTEEAAISS